MGTTTFTKLTDTEYVEIATSGDIPVTVQLRTFANVRIHYGDTKPDVSTEDYLILTTQKDSIMMGSMSSNLWARADTPTETGIVVLKG